MIVVILMIMALGSSDWLMSDGWRQGLFAHCIEEHAPTPLPFNVIEPPDCYPARDVGTYCLMPPPSRVPLDINNVPTTIIKCFLILSAYIPAAAALCIITLITDLVATVLTGLGLRSNDHRRKYKYYRIAVYVMILSRECFCVSSCINFA